MRRPATPGSLREPAAAHRRDAHPRRGAVDPECAVQPVQHGRPRVSVLLRRRLLPPEGDRRPARRQPCRALASGDRGRRPVQALAGDLALADELPVQHRGSQAAARDATATSAAAGSDRSGAFLADHREIHTVFVAARASAQFARDPANGAREALRSLPKSVRRIYVLRATPETPGSEAACVDRRRRARVTIGSTCAISRQTSLKPIRSFGQPAAASRSSTSPRTSATRANAPR